MLTMEYYSTPNEEISHVIYDNMGGAKEYYVKWNKPDIKRLNASCAHLYLESKMVWKQKEQWFPGIERCWPKDPKVKLDSPNKLTRSMMLHDEYS